MASKIRIKKLFVLEKFRVLSFFSLFEIFQSFLFRQQKNWNNFGHKFQFLFPGCLLNIRQQLTTVFGYASDLYSRCASARFDNLLVSMRSFDVAQKKLSEASSATNATVRRSISCDIQQCWSFLWQLNCGSGLLCDWQLRLSRETTKARGKVCRKLTQTLHRPDWLNDENLFSRSDVMMISCKWNIRHDLFVYQKRVLAINSVGGNDVF